MLILNKTTIATGAGLFLVLGSLTNAENRSFDGLGNNLSKPEFGAKGTNFLRVAPAAYDDGISTPGVGARKNAREISNFLCDTNGTNTPNPYALTDYVWQWGQFLDHDVTLSFTANEPFFINIGAGDPMEGIIPLMRTVSDPDTGQDTPRQQFNSVTSYIDASNVYGSDGVRAAALRTFEGGRLKMTDDGLMPMNTTGLANANDLNLPEDELFLGGDVRSNEQLGLTCMHTIFLREHNRLADQIAEENPTWDDYQIYHRARKIVGAYMQCITYREFLPAMLGTMAPDPSAFAYDQTRDPGLTNEFATAIYRIGHTMVSDQLMMMQDDGEPAPIPSIGVFDAFFTPSTLIEDPQKVDWILMGLSKQTQQNVDTGVVGSLRNQLFGPLGSGGLDLAALNIQRGRDHGLASYNDTREAYGLARKMTFAEITSDIAMQSALAQAYTDPDEIDLWIGGLVEDHMQSVPVGELMAVSMRQQFIDLAEGDRFFYKFDPELADMIDEIEATKLSTIIMRNSGLTTMVADIFHTDPKPFEVELASAYPKMEITMSGADVLVKMQDDREEMTFQLERSMDGTEWETIATDLPTEDGQVIATDPGAMGRYGRAFYRLREASE